MIKKSFFTCLLIMMCVITCTAFVGCNNKGEQIQTYSVNFYDYDGTHLGIPTSEDDDTIIYTQIIKRGESAIAPSVEAREGYTFVGWSKDYTNVTSNLEIVAVYSQICEVVFKDYDNSILKTEMVAYGGFATPPQVSDRSGYRFVGWNGDYTRVLTNTTIVAEYIEQFSVSFVDYDDELISTQLVDKGADAIVPAARDIKMKPASGDDVYEFAGWDKDYTNVQRNVTIKAVFKIKTCEVTFIDFDGSVIGEKQVVKYGTAAIAPNMTSKMYLDTKSSTKAGYRFKEFDKSFDNVKENLVVTAKYEKIEESILFAETKTYEQGVTTAKIGVYVITEKPVSGLKIKLYYDANVLTYKSIETKSKFSEGFVQTKQKDNYIEFIWTTSSDISFASNLAEIFEIEFELNKYQSAGEYGLEFDLEETQYTYIEDNFPQNQQVVLISGSVILTEKEGE